MNFKRNNIDSVPKRRATERSFGGKENNSISNSKNPSSRKVEQIFNEVRISACKTISNVKCSFDDLSQKLRRNTKRAQNLTKMQQYEELNEQVTPVKLYSPFTFVTPSPKSSRKTRSPKRFSVASPRGKLQKEFKELSLNIKERQNLEKNLSTKKLR